MNEDAENPQWLQSLNETVEYKLKTLGALITERDEKIQELVQKIETL